MNRTMFVVDNNALIALGRARVRTSYFVEHCWVTSDVLHEAGEHRERKVLAGKVLPMTSAILEYIRDLMADVVVGDTDLVDLYGNKGAADPGLVAAALAASDADEGQLLPDKWTIVTADEAVLELAARRRVPTLVPADLSALIDASEADVSSP